MPERQEIHKEVQRGGVSVSLPVFPTDYYERGWLKMPCKSKSKGKGRK